jgi:hypothetical protein
MELKLINLIDAIHNLPEKQRNELLSDARMLPGEWDDFRHEIVRITTEEYWLDQLHAERCWSEVAKQDFPNWDNDYQEDFIDLLISLYSRGDKYEKN